MIPPGYSGSSQVICTQLDELATRVTIADLNCGATTCDGRHRISRSLQTFSSWLSQLKTFEHRSSLFQIDQANVLTKF